MRQHLAKLIFASALAGCSLIYNPGNLPEPGRDATPGEIPIDAPVDQPIADANPEALELVTVETPPLLEGQGDQGSQPAPLVVFGHHIVAEATITVTPDMNPGGEVILTVGAKRVALDGNSIGIPVSARVMPGVDSGNIPLTITVTQAGTVVRTIAWELKPLPELTNADLAAGVINTANLQELYSQVDVTNIVFRGAGPTQRALVRAVANINITGNVTAITSVMNPQPHDPVAGGCAGGAAASAGACAPGGGGAASGGGGGGAGFSDVGTAGMGNGVGAGGGIQGDVLISSYTTNVGAGGGGGGGAIGEGGSGGRGGGTVELTAGGNVTLTSVNMDGAVGQGGGLTGGGGGGGAGGVILIRAGGGLTSGTVSAAGRNGGGNGGAGNRSGGKGADGRIRFDAGQLITAPAGTTPTARRGPMMEPVTSTVVTEREPPITVRGTNGDSFDVYLDHGGLTTKILSDQIIANGLKAFKPMLGIGFNRVCIVVKGGAQTAREATNCLELGYVPD